MRVYGTGLNFSFVPCLSSGYFLILLVLNFKSLNMPKSSLFFFLPFLMLEKKYCFQINCEITNPTISYCLLSVQDSGGNKSIREPIWQNLFSCRVPLLLSSILRMMMMMYSETPVRKWNCRKETILKF